MQHCSGLNSVLHSTSFSKYPPVAVIHEQFAVASIRKLLQSFLTSNNLQGIPLFGKVTSRYFLLLRLEYSYTKDIS
jgi:hypothetical protein